MNFLHQRLKRTPLHIACGRAKVEIAELLLQNGANVNQVDVSGLAALHHDASIGDTEVIKLLLRHGADIPQKDRKNYFPFFYAWPYQNIEAMKVLNEDQYNMAKLIHPDNEFIINLLEWLGVVAIR